MCIRDRSNVATYWSQQDLSLCCWQLRIGRNSVDTCFGQQDNRRLLVRFLNLQENSHNELRFKLSQLPKTTSLPMPIETACPTCQSQFRLPDNLAGQQVQCTNCHAVFTAPQVNAPAPQATAPQTTAPQTTAPQPTASSDGSFMSVFDGVSEPQSPSYGGGYTSQPQSSYPTNYNEGYAGSESSENSKLPMVIIGLVGLGLLLCLTVGVSAWYMLSGGDDNTEEVASNESSSNSSNSSPDKERDKPTLSLIHI